MPPPLGWLAALVLCCRSAAFDIGPNPYVAHRSASPWTELATTCTGGALTATPSTLPAVASRVRSVVYACSAAAGVRTRLVEVRPKFKVLGLSPQTVLRSSDFGAGPAWTPPGTSCIDSAQSAQNVSQSAGYTVDRLRPGVHHVEFTCNGDTSARLAVNVRHAIVFEDEPMQVKFLGCYDIGASSGGISKVIGASPRSDSDLHHAVIVGATTNLFDSGSLEALYDGAVCPGAGPFRSGAVKTFESMTINTVDTPCAQVCKTNPTNAPILSSWGGACCAGAKETVTGHLFRCNDPPHEFPLTCTCVRSDSTPKAPPCPCTNGLMGFARTTLSNLCQPNTAKPFSGSSCAGFLPYFPGTLDLTAGQPADSIEPVGCSWTAGGKAGPEIYWNTHADRSTLGFTKDAPKNHAVCRSVEDECIETKPNLAGCPAGYAQLTGAECAHYHQHLNLGFNLMYTFSDEASTSSPKGCYLLHTAGGKTGASMTHNSATVGSVVADTSVVCRKTSCKAEGSVCSQATAYGVANGGEQIVSTGVSCKAIDKDAADLIGDVMLLQDCTSRCASSATCQYYTFGLHVTAQTSSGHPTQLLRYKCVTCKVKPGDVDTHDPKSETYQKNVFPSAATLCSLVDWSPGSSCLSTKVCDASLDPTFRYCHSDRQCRWDPAGEAFPANSFPAHCLPCLDKRMSATQACGPSFGSCNSLLNATWVNCMANYICGTGASAHPAYNFDGACANYGKPWVELSLQEPTLVRFVKVHSACGETASSAVTVHTSHGGGYWGKCGGECTLSATTSMCSRTCSLARWTSSIRIIARTGVLSLAEVEVVETSRIGYYMATSGGWQLGGGWELARDFCESQGLRICSAREICPDGDGTEPIGHADYTADGQSRWVPASAEDPFLWLGVSAENKCRTFQDLDPAAADPWWATSNSTVELWKDRVLCCPRDGHIVFAPQDVMTCSAAGAVSAGTLNRAGFPMTDESCAVSCASLPECRFARFEPNSSECFHHAECVRQAASAATPPYIWQKLLEGTTTVLCSDKCRSEPFFAMSAGGECECLGSGQQATGTLVHEGFCEPICFGEEGMVPRRLCGRPGYRAVYSNSETVPLPVRGPSNTASGLQVRLWPFRQIPHTFECSEWEQLTGAYSKLECEYQCQVASACLHIMWKASTQECRVARRPLCATKVAPSAGFSVYAKSHRTSPWRDEFEFIDGESWVGFVLQTPPSTPTTAPTAWTPVEGMRATDGRLYIAGTRRMRAHGARTAIYPGWGSFGIELETFLSTTVCDPAAEFNVELSLDAPLAFNTAPIMRNDSIVFRLRCASKTMSVGMSALSASCANGTQAGSRLSIEWESTGLHMGTLTFSDGVCPDIVSTVGDPMDDFRERPVFLTIGAVSPDPANPGGFEWIQVRRYIPNIPPTSGMQEAVLPFVRAGDFGAPATYRAPHADCAFLPESPNHFAATPLAVEIDPPVIESTTERLLQLTYTCHDEVTGLSVARVRQVQIRRALMLNGLPYTVMTPGASGTYYVDPGANCLLPNLNAQNVTVVGPAIKMNIIGQYILKYICADPDTAQTLERLRVVVIQAPFRMFGPSLHVVVTGSPYADPGAVCEDATGVNDWTFSPAAIDTTRASTSTRTYTCTRGAEILTLTRRIVVTQGMPTPAVRAAGSTGRVVVGEHYTELGTCCIDDGRQNLGDALIFGRIDKHRPGMQSVVMPCVSPAGLAFGIRQVRVDPGPLVTMLQGDSVSVLSTDVYASDGALCQDREDGAIQRWKSAGLGHLVPLPTLRAGGSGVLDGHVENVLEEMEGLPGEGACASCVSIGVDGAVWVDLGVTSVVHLVHVVGAWDALRITVGDEATGPLLPAVGRECAVLGAPGGGGFVDAACKAPMAGRFVTLQAPSRTAGATTTRLCRVQIVGTPGPSMPSSFRALNGSGVVVGKFHLEGIDENSYPWYQDEAGTLKVARRKRSDTRPVRPRLWVYDVSGSDFFVKEDNFVRNLHRPRTTAEALFSARQFRNGEELWHGELKILAGSPGSPVKGRKVSFPTIPFQVNDVIELDGASAWHLTGGARDEFTNDLKYTGPTLTYTAASAKTDSVVSISVRVHNNTVARIGLMANAISDNSDFSTGGYMQVDTSPAGVDLVVTASGMTGEHRPGVGAVLRVQKEGDCLAMYADARRFHKLCGVLPSSVGHSTAKVYWGGGGGADGVAKVEVVSVRYGNEAWYLVPTSPPTIAQCGAPGRIRCAAADSGLECDAPDIAPAAPYSSVTSIFTAGYLEYACPGLWYLPDGSDPCNELRCYAGAAPGEPSYYVWAMERLGIPKDMVVAPDAFAPPLGGWASPVSWRGPAGGLTVRRLRLEHSAESSCPWLFGFSSAQDTYRCWDGTECNTVGCCAPNRGGVAMCPSNKPLMCSHKCGGDWCCSASCPLQFQRLCNQQPFQKLVIRGSCLEHLIAGHTTSGRYPIKPEGSEGKPFVVYCDMETAGGGWTIVSSVSGADGEPSFTAPEVLLGNPLAFEPHTLSAEAKAAISAVGAESLFVRPGGAFLHVDAPMFGSGGALAVPGSFEAYPGVTVRAPDGSSATATLAWANTQNEGGGSFGLRLGTLPAPGAPANAKMLEPGCLQHLIYDNSRATADGDAGYDAAVALGAWTATQACDSGEGGALAMYAAIRERPSGCLAFGLDIAGVALAGVTFDVEVTHAALCQRQCYLRYGCVHFAWRPAASPRCTLYASKIGTSSASATIVSGPPKCPSGHMYETVPQDSGQVFKTFQTCVDAMGSAASTMKTVMLTCEGPNPPDIFGGNALSCSTTRQSIVGVPDFATCADQHCLVDPACEAAQYNTTTQECLLKADCTGTYVSDDGIDKEVGYCRRVDKAPIVAVGAYVAVVNEGVAWTEPTASCIDKEDLVLPVARRRGPIVDTSIPGNYTIHWDCTDMTGLTSTSFAKVTVRANCNLPPPDPTTLQNPMCKGRASNDPVEHGFVCEVMCVTSYNPADPFVECRSVSEGSFESELFPAPPMCSQDQCDLPSVLVDGSSYARPCSNLAFGEKVPDGGRCLADCGPNHLATLRELTCGANALSPATFQCLRPAATPKSIFLPMGAGVTNSTLAWGPGAASPDCVFTGFVLQYRRALVTPPETWKPTDGCDAMGNRDSPRCVVLGLLEGQAYEYRVQESCVNTNLTSKWAYSEVFRQRIIYPPKPLLSLPVAGMVRTAPDMFRVVWNQSVDAAASQSWWVIRRYSFSPNTEFCTEGTNAASLSAARVPTAGQRLSSIAMPANFFLRSCEYQSYIQPNLVKTTGDPFKMNNKSIRVVQYIDPPPDRVQLSAMTVSVGLDGAAVRVSIKFSLSSEYNCTVASVGPEAHPMLAGEWPREHAQMSSVHPQWSRVPVIALGKRVALGPYKEQTMEMTGLVPSKQYNVTCMGHLKDKPWVEQECPGKKACEPLLFTTGSDTNARLQHAEMVIVAVCFDKSTHTLKNESIPISKVGDNVNLLISMWEKLCLQPFHRLSPGETAAFRLSMFVQPESRYASVMWTSGPKLNLTYTKSFNASDEASRVVSAPFSFRVCPHENSIPGSGVGCEEHIKSIRGIDYKVVLTSMVVGNGADHHTRLGGRRLQIGHHEVPLGVRVRLTIDLDSAIDSDAVGVKLGTDGFRQTTKRNGSVFEFNATGVGMHLPVIVTYEDYLFTVGASLSFEMPQISLTPMIINSGVVAGGTTSVSVGISQVPLADPASFGLVASDFLHLRIASANGNSPNLCSGPQSFIGWRTVQCNMALVPYAGLVVILQVVNASSGAFVLASSLENTITIAPSDLRRLYKETTDKDALQLSQYKLAEDDGGEVDNAVWVEGSGFILPDLMPVKSDISRFQLEVLADDSAVNASALCESVHVVSTTLLKCVLSRCFDGREMPRSPMVSLRWGELRSIAKYGLLQLPTPVISLVSPPNALDVGETRFLVRGSFFGEPLNATSNFSEVCREFVLREVPSEGYIQVFKNADIMVGDSRCEVSMQNDTYIECTTRYNLRPVRSMSGAIIGTKEVGIQMEGVKLAAEVVTTLLICGEGRQRKGGSSSSTCESCPAGRFSNSLTDDWPVSCTPCSEATYAAKDGQTVCTACPANTLSRLPRAAVTDCTCKPGYYSPFMVDGSMTAEPGQACLKCHADDMMNAPPKGLRCGTDAAVTEACSETLAHTCASPTDNSFYLLCQSGCPGGIVWPQSKPFYYRIDNRPMRSTTADAPPEYRPIFAQCAPAESCGSNNRCAEGYMGAACGACVFGYFRDKITNKCLPCDDSQIIGMVIMTAASVLMSCGCFFVVLLSVKMYSDPIFKNLIIWRAKKYISKTTAVLMSFTLIGRVMHSRHIITLGVNDIGRSWRYNKYKDIGAVFRIEDDTGFVRVAGVRAGSPAKAVGIQTGWRLMVVNGSMVRARSELDVHFHLARSDLPIRLVFSGPRFSAKKPTEDEELQEEKAKAVAETGSSLTRIVTMSLGIVQSIASIMRVQLSWPPVFTALSKFIQSLSFNFDFFHPECSIEAPYEQRWLSMVIIPYLMIIPVFGAYTIVRSAAMWQSRRDPQWRKVQYWLLHNAWLRTSVTVGMVFVQMHMEKLVAPFNCVSRADGKLVMALEQEIQCDKSDWRWHFMSTVATVMWSVMALIFSLLLYAAYKGYHWQFGARSRLKVPWYTGMLQMTAEGMKGFYEDTVDHVFHNVVSVRTFPVDQSMGWVVPDADEKARRIGFERQPVDEVELETSTAKATFLNRPVLPSEREGNPLTFGWNILVNSFMRQFCLMIAVASSGYYPPLGAAFQSTIFMANFGLILTNRPYKLDFLNMQESVMMSSLSLITFLAMFRELLMDHKRAQDFPILIYNVGVAIDTIAIFLVTCIFAVCAYNVKVVYSVAMGVRSSVHVLDEVYYKRRLAHDMSREAQKIGEERRALFWLEKEKEDDIVSVRQWAEARFAKTGAEVRDMLTDCPRDRAMQCMRYVDQVCEIAFGERLLKDHSKEVHAAIVRHSNTYERKRRGQGESLGRVDTIAQATSLAKVAKTLAARARRPQGAGPVQAMQSALVSAVTSVQSVDTDGGAVDVVPTRSRKEGRMKRARSKGALADAAGEIMNQRKLVEAMKRGPAARDVSAPTVPSASTAPLADAMKAQRPQRTASTLSRSESRVRPQRTPSSSPLKTKSDGAMLQASRRRLSNPKPSSRRLSEGAAPKQAPVAPGSARHVRRTRTFAEPEA